MQERRRSRSGGFEFWTGAPNQLPTLGKSSGPSKCGDPVMLCVTPELVRLLHVLHVRGHGALFYVLIEYVGEEKRGGQMPDREER